MDRDSHLIFESVVSKFGDSRPISAYAIKELNAIHDKLNSLSTALQLAKNAEADQLLSKIRDLSDMLISENPSAENAEDVSQSPFHYDPMIGLEKAARQIRDILLSSANDEARTEHIEKMAHIILGSPKDHDPRLYNKMLEGLIILLNKFVAVEMN